MLEERHPRKLVVGVGALASVVHAGFVGSVGGRRAPGAVRRRRRRIGWRVALSAGSFVARSISSSIVRFSSFEVRLNSPERLPDLFADLGELLRPEEKQGEGQDQDQLRHAEIAHRPGASSRRGENQARARRLSRQADGPAENATLSPPGRASGDPVPHRRPRPEKRPALRRAAATIVFLAVVTVVGGLVGPNVAAVPDVTNAGMKEYADLLATARAWYADDIAPSKLVYASIHGMLTTLDPHTNFLEPTDYDLMQEKQRGSFYGLGIIISKRNGKITVITPLEGSPADRLGIRAGDIIDRVEGQPIDDLAVDAVVKKLKGPKGTKVRITIVRPGLPEPLQMTVTRAEIPTNSVSYAFMLEPGTGYIRLKDFTQTSSQELAEQWEKLEKQGMKRLVFDLRGNPGRPPRPGHQRLRLLPQEGGEGRLDPRPDRLVGAELPGARARTRTRGSRSSR